MITLNDAGKMIHAVWNEMPIHYPGLEIGEFVVMPNHIHGIVVIGTAVGATPCGCPGEPGQAVTGRLSLGDIVHRFKTMTTKRYADGVKQSGWQPFEGRLWQRNYWEHVVRNESELNRIREYINENPNAWEDDRMNANGGGRACLSTVRESDIIYAAEGWMV
jgi:REP element-mobilizing transposase RayT